MSNHVIFEKTALKLSSVFSRKYAGAPSGDDLQREQNKNVFCARWRVTTMGIAYSFSHEKIHNHTNFHSDRFIGIQADTPERHLVASYNDGDNI